MRSERRKVLEGGAHEALKKDVEYHAPRPCLAKMFPLNLQLSPFNAISDLQVAALGLRPQDGLADEKLQPI